MSIGFEVVDRPTISREKRQLGFVFKRVFDFLVAILSLLMLFPLILSIAAAILIIEGRPIFFAQKRVGRNGQHFYCFKFRSMVTDADSALQEYLSRDKSAFAEWAASQKLVNDPRITPLGSFLRRSSLDELPQLINIFKGDMSLVGPRPIVPDEMYRYGDSIDSYLSVRPGLTGLWQVSGRTSCSYDQRVKLDKDYVARWSFAQDIKILAKTVEVVLWARGSA
jgi:exopolysaccharide production protein ExoY